MNLAHMPKLVLCGCLALGVATGACSAKPPPAADAGPTDSGLPPIIDSGPADSGPVDSGPVDAGIQLSLSDFESTYVQTLCGMLTRCQIGGTLDLTACEAEQAAITSSYNGLSTIEGLLDAGVVAYNPVFGNSCIQDLVTLPCDPPMQRLTDVPDCAGALAGQLGSGWQCIADVACVAGDVCVIPAPDGEPPNCGGFCGIKGDICATNADCGTSTTTGNVQICDTNSNTCVDAPHPPTTEEGQPCGTDGLCGAGMQCYTPLGSTSGPACYQWGDGTTSGNGVGKINGPCTDAHQCYPPANLACFATPDGPGPYPWSCFAPTQLQGACDLTNPNTCVAGAVCVPNDAQTGGICVNIVQAGEACQNLFACGGVNSSNYCDETSTHTCQPRHGPGQPCIQGLCDVTTSWCNTTSQAAMTCTAFLAVGAACTASSQCGPFWSGNTCDPVTLTCIAAPSPACTP